MSAVTSEQPHFDVRCYGPAGVELADRVWPCYDEVFGDFPDYVTWRADMFARHADRDGYRLVVATQGAAVADMQGGAVGTIATVDAQFATVELASGGKVRLPVTAFGAGSNGGLRIAMTAQQLSAAAGASGGGAGGSH